MLCKAERNSQERSCRNKVYMGADETVFHKIDKDFHTGLSAMTSEGDSEISFITTDDELIEKAKAGDEILYRIFTDAILCRERRTGGRYRYYRYRKR